MQLTAPRALARALGTFVLGVCVLLSQGAAPIKARAENDVDATTTVFYESGGNLNMTVINPAVAADVGLGSVVSLQAGWEADVVSGASVAIVDAPGGEADVDVITSATKLNDVRHAFRGGATVRSDDAHLSAAYVYGFESDYRSQSVSISAGTELFERNTALDLTYSKGWDSVCDLSQPNAKEAVERQRLPSSTGCFRAKDRVDHSLDLHSLQGSWTQAWSPIWNTQLVLSTQLLQGFQGNPYRAVWLGRSAAQEHHPENRARYAVGVGTRIWLRPVGGALQLFARAYRDTWDVRSVSGEVGYERNLGDMFRVRVRGRYYTQTSAAFFSDDYALDPGGQYFTGDRELSAMQSYLGGGRFEFIPQPRSDGTVGGFLDSLILVLKGDYVRYEFSDFHYGSVAVPNRRAIFGTVGIEATF